MVISVCCRDKVYTYCTNDNHMCYMCYRCDNECDTISSIGHGEGMDNDSGITDETTTNAVTG